MEAAAPVSTRKRAWETLSMVKNKLWLGDWEAGEEMLCKCEGGGEGVPWGKGSFTFSSAVAKAVVDDSWSIWEAMCVGGMAKLPCHVPK